MTDQVPLFLRPWTRRGLLVAGAGLAAGLGLSARVHASNPPMEAMEAMDDVEAVAALKPGQFVWYPDRAPEGFVAVVVDLSAQRAFVYRNGVRIGVSTVSTGRAGHGTPTGVFTILGKDKDHHSSTYNDAAMPYSERLTWSGVALHAGGLPGYPSSHGCVHLPLAFAKELFSVTHVGTPVIIADAHDAPLDVLEPGLLLGAALEAELATAATGAGSPVPGAPAATVMDEAVSMVISGADRSLTVMRGAKVVAEGPVIVRDPGIPLGNVVYVLKSIGDVQRWSAIAFENGRVGSGAAQDVLARITVDPHLNSRISGLMRPGATLLVTDLSAHPGTRSDGGFVVMTHKDIS